MRRAQIEFHHLKALGSFSILPSRPAVHIWLPDSAFRIVLYPFNSLHNRRRRHTFQRLLLRASSPFSLEKHSSLCQIIIFCSPPRHSDREGERKSAGETKNKRFSRCVCLLRLCRLWKSMMMRKTGSQILLRYLFCSRHSWGKSSFESSRSKVFFMFHSSHFNSQPEKGENEAFHSSILSIKTFRRELFMLRPESARLEHIQAVHCTSKARFQPPKWIDAKLNL